MRVEPEPEDRNDRVTGNAAKKDDRDLKEVREEERWDRRDDARRAEDGAARERSVPEQRRGDPEHHPDREREDCHRHEDRDATDRRVGYDVLEISVVDLGDRADARIDTRERGNAAGADEADAAGAPGQRERGL